jgi:hypothetical protein
MAFKVGDTVKASVDIGPEHHPDMIPAGTVGTVDFVYYSRFNPEKLLTQYPYTVGFDVTNKFLKVSVPVDPSEIESA